MCGTYIILRVVGGGEKGLGGRRREETERGGGGRERVSERERIEMLNDTSHYEGRVMWNIMRERERERERWRERGGEKEREERGIGR